MRAILGAMRESLKLANFLDASGQENLKKVLTQTPQPLSDVSSASRTHPVGPQSESVLCRPLGLPDGGLWPQGHNHQGLLHKVGPSLQ